MFDYFMRGHSSGTKFYEATVFQINDGTNDKFVEVRRYGKSNLAMKGGAENVIIHSSEADARASFEDIKRTKVRNGQYDQKITEATTRFGVLSGSVTAVIDSESAISYVYNFFSVKAARNTRILLEGGSASDLKQRAKPRGPIKMGPENIVVPETEEWGSW